LSGLKLHDEIEVEGQSTVPVRRYRQAAHDQVAHVGLGERAQDGF
jgi:hypothetical protein